MLTGSKTFITNGIHADLVLVVARTDPEAGARGFSLLAVERGMPGFERGRNLEKVGMKAQDTAELFFDEVRVPAAQPRRARRAAASSTSWRTCRRSGCRSRSARSPAPQAVFDLTLEYCKERTAFGKPIGSFQAQPLRARRDGHRARDRAARTSTRRCSSTTPAASPCRTPRWRSGGRPSCRSGSSTSCVQLHGGYGYMLEYPVAKAFLDARVQTIYGGTTEVMKEIIGRSLGV